jgi:endonuclease YncB( thermonuclease family)
MPNTIPPGFVYGELIPLKPNIPNGGQFYFGPEASEFTKKRVEGKTVRIALEPFEKSRDKYGRLLAYVFLPDPTMLNEQLLIHGMGYADERFDHIYRRRFLVHQKQAQKEKQGLWKSARPNQWPQWYRRRHDPHY